MYTWNRRLLLLMNCRGECDACSSTPETADFYFSVLLWQWHRFILSTPPRDYTFLWEFLRRFGRNCRAIKVAQDWWRLRSLWLKSCTGWSRVDVQDLEHSFWPSETCAENSTLWKPAQDTAVVTLLTLSSLSPFLFSVQFQTHVKIQILFVIVSDLW